MQRLTFEEVCENIAIIGTPEQCIARIKWLREEFNLSQLICWFNPGGLMPRDTVLTSMNRFTTHVMPAVR
ncbi:MAG: hypothetical protein HYZ81_18485 [Nitrospinae bacterium]|nr:hypothetical protein [Nitrospinota bacterium]